MGGLGSKGLKDADNNPWTKVLGGCASREATEARLVIGHGVALGTVKGVISYEKRVDSHRLAKCDNIAIHTLSTEA